MVVPGSFVAATDRPMKLQNLLIVHAVGTVEAVPGTKKLTGDTVGIERPATAQKNPTGHVTAGRKGDGQCVPEAHCPAAALCTPPRQDEPAAQGPEGADRPVNAQYVPIEQGVAADAPARLKWPSGVAVCTDAPAGQ